jgi:ribokinase
MQSGKKPIVVVGSINVDFVVTAQRIPMPGETIRGEDFQQHFGGKGANQAVAVARLGYPVDLIGRVGSDALGAQARESLESHGVNVEAVEVAAGPTGVAIITVASDGQNAIVISPGANASLTPEYLRGNEEKIKNAGVVLCQLEIPMETVVSVAGLCEQHRVPLILDPAPAQLLPSDLLPMVAWFTPNETEADFFARNIDSGLSIAEPERVARALLRTGVGAVALKLGGKGVLIALRDGSTRMVPARAVDVVDTTAAGDAFNGAFATALMLGANPEKAAEFACAAAAVSVTRRGAQPSMPSRDEVDGQTGQIPGILAPGKT